MDGHTEPRIGRTTRKKILYRVTRNCECEAARDHCIDPDYSTARVRERTARIAWCEPEASLYPRLWAETSERAYSVNRSRRERPNESKWAPDGNGQLAGADLRRINCDCCGQIVRVYAQ